MIPQAILDKYEMDNLDHYIKGFGEKEGTLAFFLAFLTLTDHIPNKIIEAQILGNGFDDYTEILELRQQARDKINDIKANNVSIGNML